MRFWCAIAVITGLASAAAADPPPTAAQLARAKQAFADGKKLHDAGKLPEAIEKFQASYTLSKSPLLLYNIALSLDELGADNRDLAIVYYRRFLAAAPADAAHRQDATDRITELTRQLAPPPPPPEPAPPPAAPAPHVATAADVTHTPVDAAPPDAPLDITAALPEGAPFAATLFFRGADEPGFSSTPMIRRGGELVGRVPAVRMTGRALQYYLEIRDASGAVLSRIGKPTSPNIIHLDASAPPRSYPDVGEPIITPPPPIAAARDHEDPIRPAPTGADPTRDTGERGLGPVDVARWGTTGLAGVGLGLGVTFYVLAHGHASELATDATSCGTPPCRHYDDFDRNLQRTGKLEQTLSNVALITGVVGAAAAGYLWYRELTHPGDARPAHAVTWMIAPTLDGAGRPGAAAAVRF
jgi:tetratricopeptide (TPR) repeat protein